MVAMEASMTDSKELNTKTCRDLIAKFLELEILKVDEWQAAGSLE